MKITVIGAATQQLADAPGLKEAAQFRW